MRHIARRRADAVTFVSTLFLLATPARAQTAQPPGKTCVQVQVAGQSAGALACLNEELRNQALAASGQSAPAVPLGAGSTANATGTFNKSGVAEQYGKNFGVSVIPYRPTPPTFSSAVH